MSKKKKKNADEQAVVNTEASVEVTAATEEASVAEIAIEVQEAVPPAQVEAENTETSIEATTDTSAEASTEEAPTNLITDRGEMKRAIEAMIFASPKAISTKRIKSILTSNNFDVSMTDELLEEIENEYAERGFQLKRVAQSWQFRTNPTQADILERLLEDRPVRLSASALEVLAIVAYKQPVTRAEVDAVRGIDSSHLTRGLMEKNLIRSLGHAETPGRPLLFGTTPYFLEIFGLNTLDDLPSTEEFEKELSVAGNVETDGEASVMLGDQGELLANSEFHDRPSGLPANPDRGSFDEKSEEAVEAADFGVAERALSEG